MGAGQRAGDGTSTVGRPPSPAARNAVVAALACVYVAGWTADVLLSALIPDHPVALLLLSDRLRNYPLVSPYVDAATYFGIGLVRLVAPYPCYFLLGRWYGPSAVTWLERQLPLFAKVFRALERGFGRAPRLLTALVPMNLTSVLAGSNGMPLGTFIALKVAGGALILGLVRVAATFVAGPIEAVGGWIGANRWWIVPVSALAVAALVWAQRRSTGSTDLEHLVHLDEELEAIQHEGEPVGPDPSTVSP